MLTGTCHCGKVCWSFDGDPATATACNCSICRRYGVLWIYDYEGERITLTGPTSKYLWGEKSIGFHFCPACGCVACWRGVRPNADGRRRMAVNVRLSEPEAVARLSIRHFDGFDKFEDLPGDGRCVSDMWF